MPGLVARYARRSLWRHPRRTILAVAGIGLGVGVCLFLVGMVRGERGMIQKAAAESGTGHLRVVPAGWAATRDDNLRLDGGPALAARLAARPEFAAAAPRARCELLLGLGNRLAAVSACGVDPAAEPPANRLVRRLTAGSWLAPGDGAVVVLGEALARRLHAEVDDELLATLTGADGELRRAMLRLGGVVSTGSRDLESALCLLPLPALAELCGRAPVGEVTLLVRDPDRVEEAAAALRPGLPPGAALLTWLELVPELAAGMEVDHTSTSIIVGLVIAVVLLGVAGAQLAAVLERRRELAVLAALGFSRLRLLRAMLVEGFLLGLAGGLLALLLGAPAVWYLHVHGLDFSGIYGKQGPLVSNVLVDPLFHGDFGWWLVPLAFGLSLTATMLSALYPAWYATRTDPAAALRQAG